MNTMLCSDCESGYHGPFERFERVAVHEAGPTFLNRCSKCGSLWHETLRYAKQVSASEAKKLYPSATI